MGKWLTISKSNKYQKSTLLITTLPVSIYTEQKYSEKVIFISFQMGSFNQEKDLQY